MMILRRLVSLSFLCSLQPSAKLRLPSDPHGSAHAPAADRPSTGHCGLRLWPQSTPHPPVAGLCHPEACPRHPPLRAQCQRVLGHLQRLRAGESGIRCDSSSQVIDGAVAYQPAKKHAARVHAPGWTPPTPPPLCTLISWEFPPACVVSCFLRLPSSAQTAPAANNEGLVSIESHC